jgi:hypothetical protein
LELVASVGFSCHRPRPLACPLAETKPWFRNATLYIQYIFQQKWARFLQIKNNAGYMITLNFADLTQRSSIILVVDRNGAHAGYFISQLGAIRK